MSLPIYMKQNMTRMVVMHLMKGKSIPVMYVAELLTTIICGMLVYYIIDNIKKIQSIQELMIIWTQKPNSNEETTIDGKDINYIYSSI